MKYKFKLLRGRHYERPDGKNQKRYEPGDIIESDRNLAKIFGVIKFKKLSKKAVARMKKEEVEDIKDIQGDEDDVEAEATGLKIKKVGKNRYDVVNAKGKILTDEPVSKKIAMKLVEGNEEEEDEEDED